MIAPRSVKSVTRAGVHSCGHTCLSLAVNMLTFGRVCQCWFRSAGVGHVTDLQIMCEDARKLMGSDHQRHTCTRALSVADPESDRSQKVMSFQDKSRYRKTPRIGRTFLPQLVTSKVGVRLIRGELHLSSCSDRIYRRHTTSKISKFLSKILIKTNKIRGKDQIS